MGLSHTPDYSLSLVYPDVGLSFMNLAGRRCLYINGASLYFLAGDVGDTDTGSWRDAAANHALVVAVLYLDIGTEDISIGYTNDGTTETVETIVTKANTGKWLMGVHTLGTTAMTASTFYSAFNYGDIRLYSAGELYIAAATLWSNDNYSEVAWQADSHRTNISLGNLVAGGGNVIADTGGLQIGYVSATPFVPANDKTKALRFGNAYLFHLYGIGLGHKSTGNIEVPSVSSQDAKFRIGVYDDAVFTNEIGFLQVDKLGVSMSSQVTGYVSGSDVVCTQQTLMDVTPLLFQIAAGEVWEFDAYLSTNQSGTGGMRIGFSGPSGATIECVGLGTVGSVTALSSGRITAFATGGLTFMTASGFDGFIHEHGVIVNSTTPGTIQLQVERNTGNGNARIYIGSYMLARRIG